MARIPYPAAEHMVWSGGAEYGHQPIAPHCDPSGALAIQVGETWKHETRHPVVENALERALGELAQVHENAAEEGLPGPSQQAVTNADKLLRLMCEHFSGHEFSVYPDHEGAVCIYAPGGKRWSFLVICARNGSVLCSANRPKRPWQVRFAHSDDAQRSGLLLKALHDNELGARVP